MSERRIARRYVQGLLQAVEDPGLIDRIEQSLLQLDKMLRENRDVRVFLYHPTISRERKKRLLHAIAGETAPAMLKRFYEYIIDKKRERILGHLAPEYREVADGLRGIVRARVTAAVALVPSQSERLQTALETVLQKKVVCDVQTDRSLIGGLQVMVGTSFFDGTVKGRLQRLQKHLLEEVATLRAAS
ncbi:MAG: ATP synthase F1 subunit delta [Desulfobacterota bacterium]|nr:ATP synthase F1 subunit delta [Thermodesulfobacteriota bacterium]